jgi:Domain of unknown function (DUF4326)
VGGERWAKAVSVDMFRDWLYRPEDFPMVKQKPPTFEEIKENLRGKDLACWCDKDADHCHGNVLLIIANTPEIF